MCHGGWEFLWPFSDVGFVKKKVLKGFQYILEGMSCVVSYLYR